MIWLNLSSSVHLAVTKDVISMQELLIEHDDQLGLSPANDGAPGSEWYILSESRIETHDSVTDSEIVNSARLQEWPAPEGEALLEQVVCLHNLHFLDFEVYRSEVALHMLVV